MATEEQNDEMEALKSIFENEFIEISRDPPCFMIRLTELMVELRDTVSLKITLPVAYPDEPPVVEVPNRSGVLSDTQHAAILKHLNDVANSYLGMVMVFLLVDEAKQWLNYNYIATDPPKQEPEKAYREDNVDSVSVAEALASVSLVEPKLSGGYWDFVIGLVGKPSSGKSTFFNAATSQCHAKTAAHPFTTIDPNIGRAFYAVPCPCQQMKQQCSAMYGHNCLGERLVPVTLKDVAGLVPGASEGKGKGNRFLHDLLDADVLIHVVDASGCTDENGEETTGYDPVGDIAWLFDEIHLWIYGNIMEKWMSIRRNPSKLVDMFTGYHASRAVIHQALSNAGIDSKELAKLPSWSDHMVHRVVKEFLRVRFPIYLALNKADTDTAKANIAHIQELLPECHSLPVSAEAEVILQGHQRSGAIDYKSGLDKIKVNKTLMFGDEVELRRIQKNVLQEYGATNVHRVLCEAVKLRHPVHAFPVQDLDTLSSIDKYRGEEAGRLRDCITLKPNTSVEELYTALLYQPLALLAGDFVRAETLENGKKRIMKKEEIITESNCVLKIMTNKKITLVKSKE